ncbi:helix-turn-helix domain-containing protein [Cloacibacillus porcorum]|uniref:helix-turn-helix domain-containing protein n=1 Tax=Cloacibacillus porcorum TaxID=1197717 RepID=UPI003C6CC21E
MNNIRLYRKKKELTQSQLANAIGVSLDTISRYETGKRDPKSKHLVKMASVLDCTVNQLVSTP